MKKSARKVALCRSPQGWTAQEAGWWTHPKYGGVVKERKGWGCYPLDMPDDSAAWYRRTLIGAMRLLELRVRKTLALSVRRKRDER